MLTDKQLKLDIEFLLNRQGGIMSFGMDRDTGMSSNSIVKIAYGKIGLEDQTFPRDYSDLQACENMWKKLPDHRKQGDSQIAIDRARKSIISKT